MAEEQARVSLREDNHGDNEWWVEVLLPSEFDATGWLTSACFHVPCEGSREDAIAKLRRIAEALLSARVEDCSIADEMQVKFEAEGPPEPIHF